MVKLAGTIYTVGKCYNKLHSIVIAKLNVIHLSKQHSFTMCQVL